MSYVSAAIVQHSENKKDAREFMDFLTSTQGKALLEKHGYITEQQRALENSNSSAIIGGEPVFLW